LKRIWKNFCKRSYQTDLGLAWIG